MIRGVKDKWDFSIGMITVDGLEPSNEPKVPHEGLMWTRIFILELSS